MTNCADLMDFKFLPPANEVWGKVICLQVCVCPQGEGGLVPGEVSGPGGCLVLGGAVPGPRGCLVPGGGLVLGGCLLPGSPAPGSLVQGGAWWRPPRTATAAGGTHPTGMHSCLKFLFIPYPESNAIFLKCAMRTFKQ